ncbi:hypothetical protein J4V79_18710, partial [Escherichia coli]
ESKPRKKGKHESPKKKLFARLYCCNFNKKKKKNEKKVTNMLMNKPNLSRNYITLQNPYNKQVFIEQICIFRQ